MTLLPEHDLPATIGAIASILAFFAASAAAVFAGLTYLSSARQTAADRLTQFRLKTTRVSQRRLMLTIQHADRGGRGGVTAQIEIIRPAKVKLVRQKDWQTDGSGRLVRTEMMWPLAGPACTVRLENLDETSVHQEDSPSATGWLSASVFLVAIQTLSTAEIRIRLRDEHTGLSIAVFSRRVGG